MSHCSFDLYFSDGLMTLNIFTICWAFVFLPLKMSIDIICPFSNWNACAFFGVKFLSSLKLDILILCQMYNWQIFALIL